MALFFRDDHSYDATHRMEGFDRYRQLLDSYAVRWMIVNLLTTIGALPLALAIFFAIATSSLLVLLPLSILGGCMFGPFFAALMDSLMRGLRDAPGKWWDHYKKSWRQNTKGSLLPGGVLGLMCGLYAFSVYILWVSETPISLGTVALLAFSLFLVLTLHNLYWPQLVLFQQSPGIRVKNAILFLLQHFVPTAKAALCEMVYLALMVLFAPWTLLLVPLFGFWFIQFLAEFFLYDDLNEALQIEASYVPLEGDPWAVADIDKPDNNNI